MGTVILGIAAAASSAAAATSAGAIAAYGATSAALGATAFGGVTYGGLLAAAALSTGSAMLTAPGSPKGVVNKVSGIADKTIPQQAEQLDAAALGDDESEKRKRKSAKSKFKIDKDKVETPAESGVKLDTPNKVTGVQL